MYSIKRKSQGFTMVELIIVIAVLGILAAFALPRFANFTNSAKDASKAGTLGSINSAIGIVQAQWQAQGGGTSVQLMGAPDTIKVNSSGFPDISPTGQYSDQAKCQALFQSLMTSTSGLWVSWDAGSGSCTVDHDSKPWTTSIKVSASEAK